MKRCLITGCGGFLGSHLADLLVESNDLQIYGAVHHDSGYARHLKDRITLITCELRDKAATDTLVEQAQPDFVFHLAAQNHIGRSWLEPEGTLQVNVLGTLYLLETLRARRPECKVVLVSSSAAYGFAARQGLPLSEETPFLPASPYGVSKAAAELLGHLYEKAHRMDVVRVRPFAVIGPRKTIDACSDFARGIVAIERGTQQALKVGNLRPVRDFVDARDAARGLALIAERGSSGDVYNLCTGQGHALREVLDSMVALASCPVPVEVDPGRVRLIDEPMVVGNSARLRSLGWEPRYPLRESLVWILDWWRSRDVDVGNPVH